MNKQIIDELCQCGHEKKSHQARRCWIRRKSQYCKCKKFKPQKSFEKEIKEDNKRMNELYPESPEEVGK